MYLDLTHPFTATMPAFPGEPAPELKQITALERDGSVNYELRTGLHIGTHLDAPLHFIKNGKRISDFPPEKFIGRGVVIDALATTTPSPRGRGTEGEGLLELTLPDIIHANDIVLVCTGWSKKFRDADYYKNYPVLSEQFSQNLIDAKVKIIGLDTPSPDHAPYHIHKILLSRDILIIENLTNLEALLDCQNFEIIAWPLRLEAEASPVRVIAKLFTQ